MSNPNRFKNVIKEAFQYLLILAIGLGLGAAGKYGWQWYNSPAAYVETDTSAHFADIEQKVVVYSTSWCQFCKKTREYLNQHNISFVDRDIESNDEKITELYDSIGSVGVPQVVIGNTIINGFNHQLMEAHLKQQKLL